MSSGICPLEPGDAGASTSATNSTPHPGVQASSSLDSRQIPHRLESSDAGASTTVNNPSLQFSPPHCVIPGRGFQPLGPRNPGGQTKKNMAHVQIEWVRLSSSQRRLGSRLVLLLRPMSIPKATPPPRQKTWIPACAGMTLDFSHHE